MPKNLLIIGFVWPEPKSSAAGSRMMQLIRLFNSSGYNITFSSPSVKNDRSIDLKEVGVEQKEIELNSESFDVFISQLKPDVVIFDRFTIEEQFGWRVVEQCPNALRILDTEDLHCLRRGRRMAFKDGKAFDRSYLINDTAKREIASIFRCDMNLIISEVEMTILKEEFKVDEQLLFYLPFLLNKIGNKEQGDLPKFDERSHFIFVGNFLHEPNLDAVSYLKKEIWPLIKQKLPEAELHIYGAYPTQKVQELHNDKEGFIVKGFIEDVTRALNKARVSLAPLRFGAGLKGKLIDSMINGTPIVTTTIGSEGLFGDLPPNGYIEDKTIQFVDSAVNLYNTELIWNKFQANGFKIVNTRFRKSMFQENILNVIHELINNLENYRQNNFIGTMLLHHTMQTTKFMSKWIEEKNKNSS